MACRRRCSRFALAPRLMPTVRQKQEIMEIKIIFYIILVWLFINAIFPIFLNSIERIYQSQIDKHVKYLLSFTYSLTNKLIRYFLILFFAPIIILVIIFENIYPKLFNNEIIYSQKMLKETLFKKELKELWLLIIKKPVHKK